MMLEEHRELKLATHREKEKARKAFTDEYRNATRKTFSGWTKAKHAAPLGWDPLLLARDGFVHMMCNSTPIVGQHLSNSGIR
jgi:hypothetical protein